VPYFALIEDCGPAWDPSRERRQQDGWSEHAAFMDGLVEDGFIVLGGPIGDGRKVMLLVEAQDEREIRDRLAADPWLPGVLEIESIERWSLWLGSPPAAASTGTSR
jgi:hypothetical protein